MGESTKIAWTDATWNPWYGCTKVSPGCDHCYMFRDMARYGREPWRVQRSVTTFDAPLRWQREIEAGKRATPFRVFTCSWSDFFHRDADPWREEAWDIMRRTPEVTYQVLTKRPGRMVHWAKTHPWLSNVWAGTSLEMMADGRRQLSARLDLLAQVPAPVRFVSCEPLLGPLDLRKWLSQLPCLTCGGSGSVAVSDSLTQEILGGKACLTCWEGELGPTGRTKKTLDWIIVGGESGLNARPFDLRWARSIVAQCKEAGVAVFMKQLGAKPVIDGIPYGRIVDEQADSQKWAPLRGRNGGDPAEWPEILRVREMPEVTIHG